MVAYNFCLIKANGTKWIKTKILFLGNILSEMKLDIKDSKSDVGRSACDIIKAILLDSTKDNRIVTIGLSGNLIF